MKIYLKESVWDEAIKRMRWLFNEFDNVIVGVSGGKDSTVIFHLALKVAKELKRLPVKVLFLDQEAEWAATIRTVRQMMIRPDVTPMWLQVPFRLFNATSSRKEWLDAWDESKRDLWIHPKEDIAIKENVYGVDRFIEFFPAVMEREFSNQKACYIAGVRCEESPFRYMGMLEHTYKGVCWGKTLRKPRQHFTFYPIYDWSWVDVWKAIHDNGWPYCSLYDDYFRFGVSVQQMRVSSLHHETAIRSLYILQELEPETYERLVQRLPGIDSAGHLGVDDYFPKTLPFMFKDWREYRDYLLENLIEVEADREKFRRVFRTQEKWWLESQGDKLLKRHISCILVGDYGQKLRGIGLNPHMAMIRQIKQGRMMSTYALQEAK